MRDILRAILFTAAFGILVLTVQGQDNPGCIRGVARPVVKKSVFPKAKFHMQPDNVTAIETVRFANGDKMVIDNWGCEYYVLTFHFTTARFRHDPADLRYWFNKAALLMRTVIYGINAPIDLNKGTKYFRAYALNTRKNKYRLLKLGDEIDFGGKDIRSFVTLDKIKKLKGGKFAVDLSFAMGPL